jgi:hypothetical protein
MSLPSELEDGQHVTRDAIAALAGRERTLRAHRLSEAGERLAEIPIVSAMRGLKIVYCAWRGFSGVHGDRGHAARERSDRQQKSASK